MATRRNGEVWRIARKRYWTGTDARVVVEAWRQAGEPKVRFARRHGLTVWRLARWSKRLASGQDDQVRFHPVRLSGMTDPGAETRAGDSIEIVLARGRRVRVPRGFDPEELRRVLVILEESPSC